MRKQDRLLSSWKENLHDNGYRLTEPRLLVMEILATCKTALTPLEIYELNLKSHSPLGIASVYRTLELLENLGLVQKIHQPDGCHAYWPALEGHRHLVICNECGCMVEVPGSEDIDEYFHQIEDSIGFVVNDHWLQLFGNCRECKN